MSTGTTNRATEEAVVVAAAAVEWEAAPNVPARMIGTIEWAAVEEWATITT